MTQQDQKFETLAVHAGQTPDTDAGSRALPIHQTTSFVFPSAQSAADRFALAEAAPIYTRITNPTQAAVEDRIAALEGGAAGLLLASGQSAITLSILNLAGAGDSIAVSPSLYGGSFNLFKHTLTRLGITPQWIEDPTDPASWRAAADETTRAFFVESIPNPQQDIPDLRALADVAHEIGVPLIVDNTVATPYLLRPLEHGADVVVHSATKFLGGHGTSIAGAIVDGGSFDFTAHAEKYPQFTEPDESYNGLVFAGVPGPFATRARTNLLRDLGPAVSPSTPSSSARAWRPCRCGWSATWRTPAASPTSSRPTSGWARSPGPPCPPPRTTSGHSAISRRAPAACSASSCPAASRPVAASWTPSPSTRTWRTSATCEASSSTPPRPPTRS